MTVADLAIIAILVIAGWLGWRRGLASTAPFMLGVCVALVLLRDPATMAHTWASAQMSAGTPPPSPLYVLRTSTLVQFTVRLGGAALVGAASHHAVTAQQARWREALSQPPFARASQVASALDAAVVACIASCGILALVASMRIPALDATAILHSAVVAPLASFFDLGPS